MQSISSRLYQILTEILREIYQDNIYHVIDIPSEVVLRNLVTFEAKLTHWKSTLPSQLALEPWLDSSPRRREQSRYQQVFSRLSVVIRLRYLNARILLHRTILDRMLKAMASYERGSDPVHAPFLDNVASDSLEICQDCAMEIIAIVDATSRTKALLGAWWFSIYYSKYLMLTWLTSSID